jgi:polyribonucleotide nucleotidyltransferase
MLEVKLIGADPKSGKLKLSRKVLLPKPEGYVEPAERPARPKGEHKGGHRPDRKERK